MALATYGANKGLKLMLGFTSDRRQILKAIESLGLSDLTTRMRQDPNLLTYAAFGAMEDYVAGQDTYESKGTPPPGRSYSQRVAALDGSNTVPIPMARIRRILRQRARRS